MQYTVYENNGKACVWPIPHTLPINGDIINFSTDLESSVHLDKMYKLVKVTDSMNMLYVIIFTSSNISLHDILKFTLTFVKCKTNEVLEILREKIAVAVSKERRNFCNNYPSEGIPSQQIINFNKREWPVGLRSPENWKEFNKLREEENIFIKTISSHIHKNNTSGKEKIEYEVGYRFIGLDNKNFNNDEEELNEAYCEKNVKKIASILLRECRSIAIEQFLEWMLYEDIKEKYAKFVINFALLITKTKRIKEKNNVINDKHYPISCIKDIIDSSNMLYQLDMLDEFVIYACSALCLPQYVYLLKESELIKKIKLCSIKYHKYSAIFKSSLACAMRTCLNIEYTNLYSRISMENPQIFTIDMASALTSGIGTSSINIFVPHPSKFLKLKTPNLIIDPDRRVVDLPTFIKRLNITAGQKTGIPSFTELVPWKLGCTVTGSRTATAGSIRPLESEYKSFESYITEYVKTPEKYIDQLFCLIDDLKLDDIKINADDHPSIVEITNQCKQYSDIDICYHGDIKDLYEFVNKFIIILRKYGKSFAIKRPKHNGNYSYTVYCDLFRYPMDIFHSLRDPLNLINGFMTCYPKIYFDGINAYCTGSYLAASVSGVNSMYTRMNYNDPIHIVMKSITREQITTLINTSEANILNKYLSHNGKKEAIYGNVSKKNSIFDITDDNVDSEQYWPRDLWLMPESNEEIKIWTPNGDMLIISHDIFDNYYRQLSSIKKMMPS